MQHGTVVPAYMPGSYAELKTQSSACIQFAESMHLDVMDGIYVPARTWPYIDTTPVQLPETQDRAYEIHLMVQDPNDIGVACAHAGATRVIAQVEVFESQAELHTWIQHIRDAGSQPGLSLLLETPLDVVYLLLDQGVVSFVQLMSITPVGVQGAAFDEKVYERVHTLHERYPILDISVDGGVKKENAKQLVDAGATQLVVGSAIVKSPDPAAAYQEICATL
jgi:ribulose-phosphate 3-epimerase